MDECIENRTELRMKIEDFELEMYMNTDNNNSSS